MISIPHKNILLDVGDTLVQISEPFEVYTSKAIQALYSFLVDSNGLTKDEFCDRVMQIRNEIRGKAHRTLEEFSFVYFLETIEKELIVSFGKNYLEAEKAYVQEELLITTLIDGVLPFLESAKQNGKQLYVATNNFSSLHVNLLLIKFDLAKYIDCVFISGEMAVRKPSVNFIDTICKLANLKKSETIIIGDKPEMDIQAAINSKIDSIWYNPSNRENKLIPFTYQVQQHHQLNFV